MTNALHNAPRCGHVPVPVCNVCTTHCTKESKCGFYHTVLFIEILDFNAASSTNLVKMCLIYLKDNKNFRVSNICMKLFLDTKYGQLLNCTVLIVDFVLNPNQDWFPVTDNYFRIHLNSIEEIFPHVVPHKIIYLKKGLTQDYSRGRDGGHEAAGGHRQHQPPPHPPRHRHPPRGHTRTAAALAAAAVVCTSTAVRAAARVSCRLCMHHHLVFLARTTDDDASQRKRQLQAARLQLLLLRVAYKQLVSVQRMVAQCCLPPVMKGGGGSCCCCCSPYLGG